MVIAQRIIRSKGATAGKRTGKLFFIASVETLVTMAKSRKHVFSYLTDDGSEGTIRSGRRMRKVDAHVVNVLPSGLSR